MNKEDTKAAPSAGGPELDEALGKLRSEEAGPRREGFDAILRMGVEKAVEALSARIAATKPGEEARTAAWVALHGLAVHATCPCAEPGPREEVSRAGAARLGSASPELRRILLAELRIAGRESAVPALAEALADPDLGAAALAALESNPAPAALQALREALPKSRGDLRVGIIRALGLKWDGGSLEALLREAASEEEGARLAAMEALARVGDPRAEPVLRAGLEKGGGREKREACHAYLRLGETLLRGGMRAQSLELYRRLLGSAEEDFLKCAAILGIGSAGDAGAVANVLPHLTSPNASVRAAALRALTGLPGDEATRAIEGALAGADADARAAIERVLSARRSAAAGRPF